MKDATKDTRASVFVEHTIGQCKESKGLAAALRRADNQATEYQSWEYLIGFKVNLEKEDERLPFVTIAAAISRGKVDINGNLKLGSAIANAYEEKSKSEQAKAKLRRLLACESTAEVCRLLRPLISFIQSKVGSQKLDLASLLNDLLQFQWNNQRVKIRWAQEFYGSLSKESDK